MGEAQSSASQLQILIQQVLEVNSEISQRITNLETHALGSHNPVPNWAASNTNNNDRNVNENIIEAEADESKVEDKNRKSGKQAQDLQSSRFNFTFDQDLNNSRPYARARRRNSLWSTNSSAFHTMSWSCLSGLSLTEISKVSVIGLPITAQELWNGDHYRLIHADLAQTLGINETGAMHDVAGGEEHSISERDTLPRKSRTEPLWHKRAQSIGGSSAVNIIRQSSKLPISVDRRQLENKKILLIG